LAVRIAGFLDFAHCLIYKVSATFEELDLFYWQVKGWESHTVVGLTGRAYLITVQNGGTLS
jgi:hypothetical protein